MKTYNKILEAVNRGIQLALDDFDDEDQVQNIKSKQNNHEDYTKEYLDLLKYEAIDLSLPSGTLWCKYNLGVDPTKLLSPEDWYGDYYAWGELEPNKPKHNWNNYKFGKDYNKLTKYCNNYEYGLNGFTDNLANLQSEDDVAYQNKKFYNYKFHIPSIEQFEELIKYTNNYWINNYDPNKIVHNLKDDGGVQGLNGRVFEGKNRNHLFIPATGYCYDNDIYNVGSSCYLWSSSLDLFYPSYACNLYFNSDNVNISNFNRYIGCSIRPILY